MSHCEMLCSLKLFYYFFREDEKLRLKWSNVLTLRTVLERYLDIFGRPRRYFFELLSHFTTDEDHSAKLREFASAEGQVRAMFDNLLSKKVLILHT